VRDVNGRSENIVLPLKGQRDVGGECLLLTCLRKTLRKSPERLDHLFLRLLRDFFTAHQRILPGHAHEGTQCLRDPGNILRLPGARDDECVVGLIVDVVAQRAVEAVNDPIAVLFREPTLFDLDSRGIDAVEREAHLLAHLELARS
jgi:hypothetical protein